MSERETKCAGGTFQESSRAQRANDLTADTTAGGAVALSNRARQPTTRCSIGDNGMERIGGCCSEEALEALR